MKTDILRRTAHASSEWLWRATAVSVASAGDGGVHAKRNLYAVGRARAFASIGTFDPRAMRAVRNGVPGFVTHGHRLIRSRRRDGCRASEPRESRL